MGRPKIVPVMCTIRGCGRGGFARDMCSLHYNRWWRHGDPFYKSSRGKAKQRTYHVLYVKHGELRMRTITRWSRQHLPTRFVHSDDWEIIAVGLQGEALRLINGNDQEGRR